MGVQRTPESTPNGSCQDFQRIEAEDVLQGFEKFKPETVKTTERHRITGFKVA